MKKVIRTVLIYSLILFFSIIFSIIIYCLYVSIKNPPRHKSTNIEMFKDGQWAFQYNPSLGIIPIANGHGKSMANGVTYDYLYGTYGNRIGNKNEISDPNAEILFLGCSQAWGQGVANKDIASSVIAKKLNMKVLNLSMPGTGTAYAALRLELLAELKPKYVIYLFFEDHIYRNLRYCAPVDSPLCIQITGVEQESNGQWKYRYPNYWIENYFGGIMELQRKWYLEQYGESGKTNFVKDMFWVGLDLYKRFYYNIFKDDRNLNSLNKREKVVAAFDYSIDLINEYAKKRHAKLIVVYMPNYGYPEPLKPLSLDLKNVLVVHNIEYIDMTKSFNDTLGKEEKNRGQYLFTIPNDAHINELGHNMIANEVFALIKKKRL